MAMGPTTADPTNLPFIDKPLQRYTVTVVSGPATGMSIPLLQSRMVVGRSASADLTIDDEHVSRRHLELKVLSRDRGLIVRDLHSKNGTYVRNCRIIEAFIEAQGYIELGEGTVLEVALPYVEEPGYPRRGVGLHDDPRMRAPGVLRPSSPAVSQVGPGAGLTSGVVGEVPTSTLSYDRDQLAALVQGKRS